MLLKPEEAIKIENGNFKWRKTIKSLEKKNPDVSEQL